MSTRRLWTAGVVVALAAGSCARGGQLGSPTTTTAAPAESTTTTSPVGDPEPGSSWSVVLVEAGDRLNVRVAAGPTTPVLTRLGPEASGLRATGRSQMVGSSHWYEIDTGGMVGWVNSTYLTPRITTTAFAADPRPAQLLARLATTFAARGDLTGVTSRRGLYVAHFDPLRRFGPAELAGLLTDRRLREWGSGGCSPEECPRRTFAEAVADSIVAAYDDPDRHVTVDEPQGGGNATLPEAVVPIELRNFHYLAVYDRGDERQYGGLDWTTWYVFFDLEDGTPVVVALVFDSWVP